MAFSDNIVRKCVTHRDLYPPAMIFAFEVVFHDDASYMLGEETFRPGLGAGYHDWRFGSPGKPHPATCPTCGRKTDPTYVSSTFKVKHRSWDGVLTGDGYKLISNRFRELFIRRKWSGLNFLPLPNDKDYYVAAPVQTLNFDFHRSRTRFEQLCPTCHKYYTVVGAHPACFKNDLTPLLPGFYASDLEFGSGPEQSTLLIADPTIGAILQSERLKKIELNPITT